MDIKYNFLLLSILSVFLLASCAESNNIGKNQNEQESSLDYIQKSLIISRNERIEGAWTVPQLLGSELTNEFSNSNFSGPSLSLDNNSNGFAIWRLDGILNNSASYQSRTSVNKHDSSSIGWVDDPSAFVFDANFSSFPDIQTHETLGISYALWSSNNTIYLRVHDSLNGWKDIMTIANTPFSGKLTISRSGDAIIYWPAILIDGTWTANARSYIHSSNTLTSEMQLRRPALSTAESVNITKITIAQLANNHSLFVWRENISDALTNNLISSTLNSATYDSQAGWSLVKTILGLATNTQIEKLTLATNLTTNNAELILLHPLSNLSDNLGVSISYKNGVWLPSSLILSSGQGFRKNIAIKTNRRGDIILAWSELLFGLNGQTNKISVKRYSPTIGWGNVEVVSDTLPFVPPSSGFNSLHLDYPAISLNENGNAAVTWVDNTQAISEIYINHYSPTTRWGTQQLVSISQGTINDGLKVHLDKNNKSSVIWSEIKQTFLGEEYSVWISSYSLPGSVILPPANGQNPTPTAGLPAGHALITNGCINCHNGIDANTQPINHIQTTAECNECHSSFSWRPVIVVNHNQVIGSCDSCHNGTVASGKLATHFATSNLCGACHSTVLWLPVVVLDHAQVLGTCNSCHNNIFAIGKNASHIQSSGQCEICHSLSAWFPLRITPPTIPQPPRIGVPLSHDNFIGTCESCHNNILARGKSTFHLATNGPCDSCHTTINWFTNPIGFDHSQVQGSCISCHNDISATGKTITHILSSERCEVCHTINAWIPLIFNLPPSSPIVSVPQGHNLFTNNCISCHNGTTATGKSGSHIPSTNTCQACHSNSIWRPVINVDHNEVLGPCIDCHNGVIAVGKSPFHIPTTAICASCHSTVSWLTNSTFPGNPPVFDHTQVTGSCVSCHNSALAVGKSITHIASSSVCDACHSTVLWTPIVVDHNEVIGTCESCHAAPFTHSSVGVITSCHNCHSTISWLNPVSALPGN